jgi:glycosyltransferase involved in cell wall biosynthesis
MEVFNLGYIGGDRMKAIAYSAADLFLFPTRADNLPLVLQESMACGTPGFLQSGRCPRSGPSGGDRLSGRT